MSFSKNQLTAAQKVQQTIDQIKESMKQNPDPKSFDAKIIKSLELYLQNEEFFSLPTKLIGRVLREANRILTPAEANRALKLHLKYQGPPGLGLLMLLNCGTISGGEVLEALEGIEGFPLITQLLTQPFLDPAPPKNLRVQGLEAENEKLKQTISNQYRKYQLNTVEIENLEKDAVKIDAYKKRNPTWIAEFKILKEKWIEVKTENEYLKKENTKWKELAFTKPLEKPKNFIPDIFKAVEAEDLASVEYLVKSDPKQANLQQDDEMLAEWTPLLIACKIGNLDMVKILVEAGADVNFKSSHGSPKFYASKYGNIITDYLTEHGATRE